MGANNSKVLRGRPRGARTNAADLCDTCALEIYVDATASRNVLGEAQRSTSDSIRIPQRGRIDEYIDHVVKPAHVLLDLGQVRNLDARRSFAGQRLIENP